MLKIHQHINALDLRIFVALLHTIIVKLPMKKYKGGETHNTTEFGDN